MKLKQLSLIFLFFFQCYFAPIYAAHIVGGELTYKCLGNNEYQFTMKVYRDCDGGGAGFDSDPASFTIATMTVYEGNSTTPFQTSISNAVGSIELDAPTVELLEVIYPSNCLTSLPVCVELGTYEFTLTLPTSPESYHIVYQRCCRNTTIANIILPEETGATFYVELKPEAQFANSNCQNNTPELNNYPPLVLCTNVPIEFDHSAIDDDADELLYRFCCPLRGGGLDGTNGMGIATDINGVAPSPDAPPLYENVSYILPTYSCSNPLGGDPQITIDSQTGMITGTPTVTGQFVVGVCVDEYRNGNLLSTVRRDFQFNIKTCEESVIASDFTYGLSSYTANFENQSVNAVSYSWDFGDSNTSTEVSPNHTYAAIGTYSVTLNSYNDICQLVDSQSKEVVIMTTSIEEEQNDLEVTITPNPSDGKFYVEINNLLTKELQVELFDLNGKRIFEVFEDNFIGNYVESFDQTHLPKGIYFLKFSTANSVQVNRVVIQ